MQAILFGYFGLVCSGVLMLYIASLIAFVISTDTRERFWVGIVSIALQLGTVSTFASLFTQLTPIGWIVIHSGIFLCILFVLLRLTGHSLPPILEIWRELGEKLLSRFKLSAFSLSLSTFWLICVLGILILSGVFQLLTPIFWGDDKMYHASRVAYWIQHQSIFPYVTHNDRQVVFSFGSELFFLWPLLFTKTELVGRMVFWLGFPISAIGLCLLIRELQLNRTVATAGTVAFLATPIVLWWSFGLNPAIWLSVFVLGAAFWILRAARQPDSADKYLFFAALNVMVAVGVQFIVLAIAPLVILLPFLIGIKKKSAAIKCIIGGALLGLLTSGLIVSLGFNEINYGNPFGPASMRKVHTSDLSLIQIYTHTVRLPFELLEFPVVPSAEVRDLLTRLGNGVISLLHADRPLPLETTNGWPGDFSYLVRKYAFRYSLGGIFWLPALVIVLAKLIREIRETFPSMHFSPLSLMFFLDILFLAGIVYLIRWQSDSFLPDRFLVAPFALAIAISAVLVNEMALRSKFLAFLSAFLIFSIAALPVNMESQAIWRSISQPFPLAVVDEPFSTALGHIPSGSSILLVAEQDAGDYPLFNPREHYSNRVIPWGKVPFDSGRMQALIQYDHVTHILIQNDQLVDFNWEPPISTVEMTNWLANQSYLTEIPLNVSGMRLFARV